MPSSNSLGAVFRQYVLNTISVVFSENLVKAERKQKKKLSVVRFDKKNTRVYFTNEN